MQFNTSGELNGHDAITLFVSGDFCPIKGSDIQPLRKTPNAVFSELHAVIHNSNISIMNLECPLTICDTAIEKIGPNLKTDPEIEDISRAIADDELIAKYWKEFVSSKTAGCLVRISGFGRYKAAVLRRLGLLDCFYRRAQLNNVRQMIRCEAHKEIALDALSNYLK